MSSFTWRTPGKQDRRLLQTFTCAEGRPPDGRLPFWENEVQKYFRQDALADTNRSAHLGQRFRIAEDASGIVGAYTHARPESLHPDLRLAPDQACRGLLMLGVATRHRHQGGKVADQVFDDALYDMAQRESARKSIVILGHVDRRNVPSQRMLRRQGFEEVVPGTPAERLGLWMLTLDL
ncbi:hypothetical protein GCM10010349_75800 [Streptomyces flavofungini]|nr:hypothetical protein GCM10010349_75800 [Streptomyces flavofungini]